MNNILKYKKILNGDELTKAKLTYVLTWILIVSAAPFYFIFNLVSLHLGIPILIIVGAYFISLIFNWLGHLMKSRCIFLINTILATFYYSQITPDEAGVHLVFFACLGYPFILFTHYEKNWQSIFVIIPFCFLLLHVFNIALLNKIGMTIFHQKMVYSIALFVVSLKIILCYHYFVQEINHSQTQLAKKNNDLKNALKKLKESREAQVKLTQYAEYAKLVQSIAHEFKNPLQMLQGTAEIGQLKDSKNRELFDTIISSVDRLNNVIQPLLLYLNKKTSYAFDSVNIVKIIKEIMLLSKANCKSKHIKLKFICDHKNICIHADGQFIGQVIINLLTNAIESMSNNGGAVTIQLVHDEMLIKKETRPAVKMNIVDTGCGIPEEKLNTIFLPYESNHSGDNNLGLGLSIVAKVIKDHHGLIKVESSVGVGTTVSVWLPLSENDNDNDNDSLEIPPFELDDSFFET